MAKQSGIHQLRGKVGEMSYYRTKGVETGVVRRINQGMSARVKNGEEFVNTRLNNAEFKNANAIATAAFNAVNNRKRGMMRTFAISAMTKRALEDIKQGSQSWGVRMPITELDILICDMLENYAKSGRYDGQYGDIGEVTLNNQGNYEVMITLSEAIITNLSSLGIDGLYVAANRCLAGEIVVDNLPRLFAGSSQGSVTFLDLVGSTGEDVGLSGSVATPRSVGMSNSGYEFAKEDPKHGFYLCVTFMPTRNVGSHPYILQELCTYVAIPLGQIPEE